MLGEIVLALLGAEASMQEPQGLRTPAGYAANLNWDKSKGPLIYLPSRELMVKDSPRLEGGFGVFSCGTVHVIAPNQMTVIDPDYQQSPNVYDGLPRRLKVLYLASTFTPSQWQIACGVGLGLGDMTSTQQAVYRSILPSQFQYQTSPVWNPNSGGGNRGQSTQTILSPDQESQVRLRIYKEMSLGVRLGNQGSFSAIGGQEWNRHKTGEMLSSRIGDTVEDHNFAFGVEVRRSLPNQSKPSDLDYKSSLYDRVLTLQPSSSVKEICKAASDLTHRTIIPDARFQGEQVTAVGMTARCGDVLRGLALCLTGTYRKVGNTYVLTSDIEGIGAKMAKLAFWQWNLKQVAEKESDKWKSQIAANPGIRSIAYAADDPYTPNEAMRKFMDTDFDQGDKTMPASEITPAWSQLLNSKDHHFFEPLRTDVAEPWDSVFWCFVAPGGHVLHWEDELCDLNEFTHYAERHPAPAPRGEQKKASLGGLLGAALIYQSNEPELTAKLPQLAKGQGFSELWLQTTNSEALSAATKASQAAGITLKLVVEPFTAVGDQPKDQLDRSILGTTYSQSEGLVDGSEWVRSSNEWLTANERAVDFLSENSPSLEGYWKSLISLASKPEVAGTVVMSGTPVGYEMQSDWPEYEVPQLAAPLSMGYTTDLRERFLIANSVDPVDLLEVRDQSELQPLEQSISSFGDLNNYTYGKVAENPPAFRDKWDKARWHANEDRLRQFEANFKPPLLVEWRRKLHDTSMKADGVVSPPRGDVPAETQEKDPYEETLPEGAYYLQRVGYPLSEGAAFHLRRHIAIRIQRQATRFAIDLRAVPDERLVQILGLLFTPDLKLQMYRGPSARTFFPPTHPARWAGLG